MGIIYKNGNSVSDGKVATNSLDIKTDELVSLVGGFVVKASGTTGKIEGVSKTGKVFPATNQTVQKEKVVIINDYDLRLKLTTDAAITEADVGSSFTINTNQTVDVASIGASGQVRLEEVLTGTVGLFSIN